MASILNITIKKEDDTLPRPSIIPKRKAAIVNIPPRARFAKARPNIGGIVSKAAKETQPFQIEKKNAVVKEDRSYETEKSQLSNTDSTSVNSNGQSSESESLVPTNQPLKKEPEFLQRPSALPKRTTAPLATPRARYQKARPNIAALANKTPKSGNIQKDSGRLSVNEKEVVADSSELKTSETQGDLGKESRTQSTSGEKPIRHAEPVKGFSFSKGEIEIFPEASEESILPNNVEYDNVTEDQPSSEVQGTAGVESLSLTNETETIVPSYVDYVVLNYEEEQEFFECTAKEQQKQEKKKSNYLKDLSKIMTKNTCETAKEGAPSTPSANKSFECSKSTCESAKESAPPTPSANRQTDYPTLKSILNSPRKRTTTKKTYERKRRLANLSETPSRSEMTMTDLIYFNPTGEPMKVEKPQTCAVENLPPDENTKPVEEEPEEDESSNAPVPKVIINENGEIIIDESSLVVRRKETIDTSIEAIIENDNTTYSSFRKKSSRQWANKETSKFYKALSLVGTDFALMENIFRAKGKVTRSRRELKLKFKREEKLRVELVHRAMYDSQTYDLSILDEDPDDPSAEDVDDAPQVPVVKKRGRKPKAAGDENQSTAQKKKKKSKNSANESGSDENDEAANDVVNDDEPYEDSGSRNSEVISAVPEPEHNEDQTSKEISRPQRVRKSKILSDFVTDVDDSENSDDYISETNCETIVRKKKPPDCSESIENEDDSGQSLPIEKPVKVRKRKKLAVLPIDYFEDSSDAQDVSNPSEVECAVTDVSRVGRVRRAKLLSDFVTDEIELQEADISDNESVMGVRKRRKVQALSEDSSEECFDEEGENCILVEHIDRLPETSAMEVIERVKEESEESPELVMQQKSTEDNQDVVFLATIRSPREQDPSELTNNHRTLQSPAHNNTDANFSYKTMDASSQNSNHKQSPAQDILNSNIKVSSNDSSSKLPNAENPQSSALVERNEKNCEGGNISTIQCIDLEQPIKDDVINLISDTIDSEVVITGSTKTKRMRRRAAAPNVARGKQRPRVEVEMPHVQPSFSHFTPAEEHSSPPTEIKTYSRNIKRENPCAVASSSLQVDHTIYVDPGTSFQSNQTILEPGASLEHDQIILDPGTFQNNQTILDAVTSFPNSQAITLDSDTADPPPMMIFTKSPNNENILHLFMVSPKHSY